MDPEGMRARQRDEIEPEPGVDDIWKRWRALLDETEIFVHVELTPGAALDLGSASAPQRQPDAVDVDVEHRRSAAEGA